MPPPRSCDFRLPIFRTDLLFKVFCGSHTHSGPAAWVPRAGHLLGPSADFFDWNLFNTLAKNIGRALVLGINSPPSSPYTSSVCL